MTNNKSSLLIVVVNKTPILEYDREKALSDAQHESLRLMDETLEQGFNLGDEFIASPNLEQRVQFVTANLISATLNEQDVLAAASCAYLAKALPDLKQVKAVENNGEVSIELIFDREYQKEVAMEFVPPNKFN